MWSSLRGPDYTEPTQNRNFRWSWNFWPWKALDEIRLLKDHFSPHDCFVINRSVIEILFLQSSVTMMMMSSNPHYLANGFCCVTRYLVLFVWETCKKIWFYQHGVIKNAWVAKKYQIMSKQKFLGSGDRLIRWKLLLQTCQYFF